MADPTLDLISVLHWLSQPDDLLEESARHRCLDLLHRLDLTSVAESHELLIERLHEASARGVADMGAERDRIVDSIVRAAAGAEASSMHAAKALAASGRSQELRGLLPRLRGDATSSEHHLEMARLWKVAERHREAHAARKVALQLDSSCLEARLGEAIYLASRGEIAGTTRALEHVKLLLPWNAGRRAHLPVAHSSEFAQVSHNARIRELLSAIDGSWDDGA